MVFPWIPFLKQKAGGKLSDIEFLAIKEFDSKLRYAEGHIAAAGDLATLTANTGKDMYLATAKCTIYTNPTSGFSAGDQVVIKANGTIIETTNYSQLSAVGNAVFTYEFKNIGHKVLAGQIIKMEVITLDTDTEVDGYIECFEETTGETPQVASI